MQPDETEEVGSIDKKSCDKEHDNEVIANIELPDDLDELPTTEEWANYENECITEFADYTGEDFMTSEDWDIYTLRPSEDSFDDGDTAISCILASTSGDSWTGSPSDASDDDVEFASGD